MDTNSPDPTLHFLRQKLNETRQTLDEACQALQVLHPSTPPRNLIQSAVYDPSTAVSNGALLNLRPAFEDDTALSTSVPPPIVPAPSIFCLDIIEMEGAVKVQLMEQMSLPVEQQSR